jgi:hypothetical protein
MDTTYVEEIARQLDHMKPEHLEPGVHVGMEIMATYTLRVIVREPGQPTRRADVTYWPGHDHYSVDLDVDGERQREIDGVYCDQIGEIVFGDNAKPWTMPFGAIIDPDTGKPLSTF